MTGKQLINLGRKLYGGHGWQTKLAKELGRDTATIRRWQAMAKVPKIAALALSSLKAKKTV